MKRHRCKLQAQFIIAVRRGALFQELKNPELKGANRIVTAVADRIIDGGCVYMQLKNGKGQVTSYYYDNNAANSFRVAAFGVTLISALITSALTGVYQNPLSAQSALVVAGAIILPVTAGTIGPGIVRRRIHPEQPDATLVFDISQKKFYEMEADLKAVAGKSGQGVYSMLFNNCSGYAIKFAEDHGLKVPKPLWQTPGRLARKIEALEM